MLVCTLGGLHVDVWPLGLVGDIIRPLGSAKKPGFIRQKIPDLDIRLASHIDPDTRDTATPHVRGSGAPSAQTLRLVWLCTMIGDSVRPLGSLEHAWSLGYGP